MTSGDLSLPASSTSSTPWFSAWKERSLLLGNALLPSREAWWFALQMVLASALTLYMAFVFQVEASSTALVSVWIVANPGLGMTLSKAIYRLIGTVAGAFVGVLGMGLFGQSPGFLVGMLALWLGICTAAGTLFRNFRTYGTILAGYTATLVCLASLDHPESVVYIALNRALAVSLGIGGGTLISLLFAPRNAYRHAVDRISALAVRVARRVHLVLTTEKQGSEAIEDAHLIGELMTLETAIEFAALEDVGFRSRARLARRMVIALMGLITEAKSLEKRLPSQWSSLFEEEIKALLNATAELCADLAQITPPFHPPGTRALRFRERVRELKEQLQRIDPFSTEEIERDPLERIIIEEVRRLLGHLEAAAESLTGQHPPLSKKRPALHLDYRLAFFNGMRATISFAVAGLFWIHSCWPAAANFLVISSVAVGLFSVTDQPVRVGKAFLIGAAAGILIAFFCTFEIVQRSDGFALLILGLTPFLILAALLNFSPKSALYGGGFSIVLFTLLQVQNSMQYSLAGMLNTAIAVLVGASWGVACYQLFFPPDPKAAQRHLARIIRRDLEKAAITPLPPSPDQWRHTLFDRIRLMGKGDSPCLPGSLAALHLGLMILRLRNLRNTSIFETLPPDLKNSILTALIGLGGLAHAPLQTRSQLQQSEELFSRSSFPSPAEEHFRLLALAELRDILATLEEEREFFRLSASSSPSLSSSLSSHHV